MVILLHRRKIQISIISKPLLLEANRDALGMADPINKLFISSVAIKLCL